MPVEKQELVILEYADLVSGKDLTADIERAYGYTGLGLLVVRGVPDFAAKRQAMLPLAHKFANLPDSVKSKTESPETQFSFGWSHGKESLEGKPDYSKGSYYNNPQYDRPVEDEELIKKFPSFLHPNVWPQEMPELRGAFMDLGQLIVSVGTLVAQQCDRYVKSQLPAYKEGLLEGVINTSLVCKGRMLHYFPAETLSDSTALDESAVSSWCGWHQDHGSLTGLTPAMFFDDQGNQIKCPDPAAGLYIRSRQGALVHMTMPADVLAFQIGEAAQIHSGGVLQATPHAVRGAMNLASKGVSRSTMAVFMEPNWNAPMRQPEGVDPAMAHRGSTAELLPKGVPTLGSRWKPDMDFNDFTVETLSNYYK